MIASRRIVLAALLVAAFVTPAFALLQIAPNAAAYSGIEVSLQRPAFAGLNETVECVMTISGGPAQGAGNYSYSASIVGTNTTGSYISPAHGPSQSSGTFLLNVTMPAVAPETIKVRVNATSTSASGGTSDTLQRDFEIKVVVPIVIQATVVNTGSVGASNVTASFYADGVLLSSQTFNVSANSTQQLAYNWTFLNIKTGKHVVTVVVNDPNKVVEFTNGNNVISRDVWIGGQSNAIGAVLTGGVIVLAFLVFLMYIQKPMRRPKAKK